MAQNSLLKPNKGYLKMWSVKNSPQVSQYIKDFKSERSVLLLQMALIRLFFSDNGLPSEGELIDCTGRFYWWIIHHHSLLLKLVELEVGNQQVLETLVLRITDSEVRGKEEIDRQIAEYGQSDI